jgi:hypothetical protein
VQGEGPFDTRKARVSLRPTTTIGRNNSHLQDNSFSMLYNTLVFSFVLGETIQSQTISYSLRYKYEWYRYNLWRSYCTIPFISSKHTYTQAHTMVANNRILSTFRRRRATVASVLCAVAATASGVASFVRSPPSVDAFSSPSPNRALFPPQQQYSFSVVASLLSSRSTSRRAVISSNSDISSSTARNRSNGILSGSPLEMICKDQQEFELQVGHAMDTLRDDYPHILTKNPG